MHLQSGLPGWRRSLKPGFKSPFLNLSQLMALLQYRWQGIGDSESVICAICDDAEWDWGDWTKIGWRGSRTLGC